MGIMIYIFENDLGNGINIYIIAIPIVICSLIFSFIAYYTWLHSVNNLYSEIELTAELNDQGVKCATSNKELFIHWNQYDWYIEESNALKLKNKDGSISFIPINENTLKAVEFTKTKIPHK